mmetsp:Transcript_6523/g.10552  ORF Transcript_6523/g.10552 Transcript_6523/m.10552 type:complete len:227 (-) Transcript_6523:194-874(-)
MKEGWYPHKSCSSQDHMIGQDGGAVDGAVASYALSGVFSSMLESSKFSDVSLVCQDGQTLECHKVILSAWSSVFSAMFTHSDMIEGQTKTVSIQDIKPNAVKALVKCMYGGHLQCEPADELDVLAAAEKYSVESVKQQCLKSLIDRLHTSPDDVPEVVAFTDLHVDLKCLRYAAIQALSEKKDEIMSSEGWNLLCETAPKAALKAVNEARLFENPNGSQINCDCWK